MMTENCRKRHVIQVHVGPHSRLYEALSIEANEGTTAAEIVDCIREKLGASDRSQFELAEVIDDQHGELCKERRLQCNECPVRLQALWPMNATTDAVISLQPQFRFCLRRRHTQPMNWSFSCSNGTSQSEWLQEHFLKFLCQPKNKKYPDLCQLPDLSEQTLLNNLRARFYQEHIYTYVGSILIAVNPFKFLPIYNPKYVQLYQNRRLGELPPHIFAIADAAYQTLRNERRDQCIVISGESGSGKTESTNFLLHHLAALSARDSAAGRVEQIILAAGPILEAFGNAQTKHNDNSSRFGKFVQLQYRANGLVSGALVRKYLLEKSRITSPPQGEYNYHVFYYLLSGTTMSEKQRLCLLSPADYTFLQINSGDSTTKMSAIYNSRLVAESSHEFVRLKQSLELVGFDAAQQFQINELLSAILLLGNVQFARRTGRHQDEHVLIRNEEVVRQLAQLLHVQQEDLTAALTTKRTKPTKGETIVMKFRVQEALRTRDAMAQCLYEALFEWIVLRLNQALLPHDGDKGTTHTIHPIQSGNSIGVLDIFGFENLGCHNHFEQFCINYANEHLHQYFNEHVFKYEQEEYESEGIDWKHIPYMDNAACLRLIEGRPSGLLCLLEDQCSFPSGSGADLLRKFSEQHRKNQLFQTVPCNPTAFIIQHFAGPVQYQIEEFKHKNVDLMRPDVVQLLRRSRSCFVRQLVCGCPVSLFRWRKLRAFLFAYVRFASQTKSPSNYYYECNSKNGQFGSQVHQSPIVDSSGSCEILRSNDQAYCVKGHLVRATSSPSKLVHNQFSAYKKSEKDLLDKANAIIRKNQSNRNGQLNPIPKSVGVLQQLKQMGLANGFQIRAQRKSLSTVTQQFQQSLHQLMKTLEKANPYFVRCIKSNSKRKASYFDDQLVLLQLRYTGMLDTVRIRQCGYLVRFTYKEFCERYRGLIRPNTIDDKVRAMIWLSSKNLKKPYQLQSPRDYQLGHSKVYLREAAKAHLDQCLHQHILSQIVKLQAAVRGWIRRKQYVEAKQSVTTIQRWWRHNRCRSKVVEKSAAIVVHKALRAHSSQQKANVMHIQSELFKEWIVSKSSALDANSVLKTQNSFRSIARKRLTSQNSLDVALKANGRHAKARVCFSIDSPVKAIKTHEFITNLDDSIENVCNHCKTHILQLHSPQSFRCIRCDVLSHTGCLAQTQLNIDCVPKVQKSRSATDSNWIRLQYDKTDESSNSSNTTVTTETDRPMELNTVQLNTTLENLRGTRISVETDVRLRTRPAPHLSNRKGNEVKSGTFSPRKDSRATLSVQHRNKQNVHRSSNRSEAMDVDWISPFVFEQSKQFDLSSDSVDQLDSGARSAAPSPLFIKVAELRDSKDVLITDSTELHYMEIFVGNKLCELERRQANGHSAVDVIFRSALKEFKENLLSTYTVDRAQHNRWLLTKRSANHPNVDVIAATTQSLPNDTEDADENKAKNLMNDDRTMNATIVPSIKSPGLINSTCKLTLTQRTLIEHFEQVLRKVCTRKPEWKTFPIPIALNAFRAYLEEFKRLGHEMKPMVDLAASNGTGRLSKANQALSDSEHNSNPVKVTNHHKRLLSKRKTSSSSSKKKHRQSSSIITAASSSSAVVGSDVYIRNGHQLTTRTVHIPTVCELCGSLLWLVEKAYVCQQCKLTCHKRCLINLTGACHSKSSSALSAAPKDDAPNVLQQALFGVPLQMLLIEADARLPATIHRLITTIELRGLYTEGLYRKSALASAVEQLKRQLNEEHRSLTNDQSDAKFVDLNQICVHVLAAVFKCFLRELPEPLLTYALYDDFLWAATVCEPEQRVQAIFVHIQKLPYIHFELLQRVLFHLARVAQHESDNRMNAHALAIVFAPSLLRCEKVLPLQDRLDHIQRQTCVIEVMIQERLKHLRNSFKEIEVLDQARISVSSQLQSNQKPTNIQNENEKGEKQFLEESICTLKNERDNLANDLVCLSKLDTESVTCESN